MKIQSKRDFKKVLTKMIDINPNTELIDFVCATDFKFKMKTYKGRNIIFSPLCPKRSIYLTLWLYQD